MFITSSAGAIAAGALLGGLGGSNQGKTTQTQTQTIDPRMADAIYGSGGLVPTMSDWYKKNNTGMNDQMLQGLNQQYAVLNDPMTKAGYDRMGVNGYNLMGGSVAGNPFSNGSASLTGRPSGFMRRFGGGGMPAPMALASQPQSSSAWGSLGLGGPFSMPALYTPPTPPAPVIPDYLMQAIANPGHGNGGNGGGWNSAFGGGQYAGRSESGWSGGGAGENAGSRNNN